LKNNRPNAAQAEPGNQFEAQRFGARSIQRGAAQAELGNNAGNERAA